MFSPRGAAVKRGALPAGFFVADRLEFSLIHVNARDRNQEYAFS